jgi:hypothetical protein
MLKTRSLVKREPVQGAAEEHPTALRIPNFLYIGASKAGSTWIFGVLARHPDVYLAPGKGLYYFDGHFQYGRDWYLSRFAEADGQAVVGEISHSYLYSAEACGRIAELNPHIRLMVCAREPVERAFSAYLDGIKNGQFDMPFEEALKEIPSLIDRGRYATHLQPYLERFGREQIHIALFDDLKADPQRFATQMFEFLGVAPLALTPREMQKMMPAARPRSKPLAALAKKGSAFSKKIGLRQLRGRIKRSRWIRNLLYSPYRDEDKPRVSEGTRQRLREIFRPEVETLGEILGQDLLGRWSYQEERRVVAERP